jgi:hypothetical protein
MVVRRMAYPFDICPLHRAVTLIFAWKASSPRIQQEYTRLLFFQIFCRINNVSKVMSLYRAVRVADTQGDRPSGQAVCPRPRRTTVALI